MQPAERGRLSGGVLPLQLEANMAQRPPDTREADSWFSDEQLARVEPSETGETSLAPVPTRMVSSGEYMPHPQTEEQMRVEHRIKKPAAEAPKKLGMNRREFLGTGGGMAACFLAMNDVYGRFFNVSRDELFEPAAHAAAGPPKNLFVVDDQLHTTRGSLSRRARRRPDSRATHSTRPAWATSSERPGRPGIPLWWVCRSHPMPSRWCSSSRTCTSTAR